MQSAGFRDGFGRAVTRDSWRAASCFAAGLGIVAVIARLTESVALPQATTFVPIESTFSFCAAALAAVLLVGQFYVSGSVGVVVLASAFEISAIFAIPHLIGGSGEATFLWTVRQVIFATLVATAFVVDPRLDRRIYARGEIDRTLGFTVFASAACGATLAIFAAALSPHVPAFSWTIVCADAIACAIVLGRGGYATNLAVWIALSTFASGLEGALGGLGGNANALGWYLARVPTSLGAGAVLFVLFREIAALYLRLTELATRDALTGLPNRRGLDEYLRGVYAFAERRRLGFALLVVDIDHFKRYNDRYGHARGDVALRRVAALLRKSAVRRHDFVARFGGEEFVVALCDVTVREAIVVAERLQKRVERARIAHEGMASGIVSVSVGIGKTDDAARTSLDELFEVADRALYQAKDRGRNRYVVATCAPDVDVVASQSERSAQAR